MSERQRPEPANIGGVACHSCGYWHAAPSCDPVAIEAHAASPANARPCLHGALPGRCAFAGCPHFAPDGPRDEKWAFRPGTTPEDIAAALAENEVQHARAPGSASPIHLVVDRKRLDRIGAR